MEDKDTHLFLLDSPTLPLSSLFESKPILTLPSPNIHSKLVQIPISTEFKSSTPISKTLIGDK